MICARGWSLSRGSARRTTANDAVWLWEPEMIGRGRKPAPLGINDELSYGIDLLATSQFVKSMGEKGRD